jgi:hypothetical protein
MTKKLLSLKDGQIFWFTSTLVIVIIIAIIAFLYRKRGDDVNVSKPWCILLTTCVKRTGATPEKTQEMISLYTRSIDMWLEKTNLPIVVVDSSDYKFEEYRDTRLKVCHFIAKESSSSSNSESESILYAMNSINIREYKYIMKITGRYYIDEFEIIINRLGESDLYVQHLNRSDIEWQHSEVFGFDKKYAEDIFKPIIQRGIFTEKRLWEVSHSKYKVETLPPMENILKVVRGGDGLLVDPL